jgi:hypothetical protein
VLITLLSGAIAGTVLGVINQALVEPHIDRAISIETQNAIKEGEVVNPLEFQNYRLWQKGGEIMAGTIIRYLVSRTVWHSISLWQIFNIGTFK